MAATETEYTPMKGDTVLIAELASGSTKTAAANKAGVHVGTVTARFKDPGFLRALNEQRSDLLSEVSGILASSAAGAALVLEELYSDEDEPAHVRRSAARDVLEFSIRVRELHEMEERMATLEKMVENELSLESSYD